MSDKAYKLARLCERAYEKGCFSGVAAYGEAGSITAIAAMGTADETTGRKITEKSVFDIASVSKQFTAAAALMLINEGKLSLEDTVGKFFPNTAFSNRTVRNLLDHTCGLPDYMKPVIARAKETGKIPDNSAVVDFLASKDAHELFVAGERFAYSNTGYALAASIVAKASDMPFADFLKKRVFEPAGMENTAIVHRRLNGSIPGGYAYGYVLENGRYVLADYSETGSFVVELDGIEGDGAVHSTAYDLIHWSHALDSSALIPEKLASLMATPARLKDGSEVMYGFGYDILSDADMGTVLRHGGAWPGYSSEFRRIRGTGDTLAILMNTSNVDVRARFSFVRAAVDIWAGREAGEIVSMDDIIRKDVAASDYDAYLGEYEYGLKLSREGDALYLTLPFRAEEVITVRIYPAKGDVFVCREAAQEITLKDSRISLVMDKRRVEAKKL